MQGLDEYELERLRSKKTHFEFEFREFQAELFSEDMDGNPRKELQRYILGSAEYFHTRTRYPAKDGRKAGHELRPENGCDFRAGTGPAGKPVSSIGARRRL